MCTHIIHQLSSIIIILMCNKTNTIFSTKIKICLAVMIQITYHKNIPVASILSACLSSILAYQELVEC